MSWISEGNAVKGASTLIKGVAKMIAVVQGAMFIALIVLAFVSIRA